MTHTHHPLADAYPLMSEADLTDLAESIKANGQREPIYLLGDDILDGRNREAACERAGVEPWYEQYTGPTDDDSLRAFIEDKNEHRRHLTPDFLSQRRAERIARVAEKRRTGKTHREIAEEEGVSRQQVSEDIKEAVGKGLPTEPEEGTVEGKDKKKYPAKRKKKPPAEPSQNGHAEPIGEIPQSPNGVLRDPLGIVVGEKQAAAFDPAHEALRQQALTLCRQLTRVLNDYAASPAGAFIAAELKKRGPDDDSIRYKDDGLEQLVFRLKQLAPHCSRCPYCLTEADPKKSGRNCRSCRGLDWVPFRVFESTYSLPSECREAVEQLRKEARG